MTSDEIATIRSALAEMQAREEERYAGLLREFDTLKASNARTHDRIDEVKTTVSELSQKMTEIDTRVDTNERWLADNGHIVERIDRFMDKFTWPRVVGFVGAIGIFLTMLNGLLAFVARVH